MKAAACATNLDYTDSALKNASRVALAAMLLALLGAIYFYKERLFFLDSSFLAFNIINQKKLDIQQQRYGAFITQIVPYLGAKLNLPIRTILLSFTLSYNVFYLTVAGLLHKMRQYRLTIILAMYYFLLVSAAYYWTSDELHQAIAWTFLFLGVTLHLGARRVSKLVLLPVFVVLGGLAISTHYIVVIPLFFLWGYLIIEKNRWPFPKKDTILLTCILLLLPVIKFAFGKSGYDDAHLHGVTHFSLQDIIDSFSTPVVTLFFQRCLTNYWVSIIVFISGMSALVYTKARGLAWWSFAATLGYIIIIGLTYGHEPATLDLYHIETEWQSLGIIIAAPLALTALPRIHRLWSATAVACVFAVRIYFIAQAAPAFLWRSHFKEMVFAQMSKHGITKLAIYSDPMLDKLYIQDWSMGIETLLQSAMEGDKPQRTFLFVKRYKQDIQQYLLTPKAIYLYAPTDPNAIDSRYFYTDTTHPYRIMSYAELMNLK